MLRVYKTGRRLAIVPDEGDWRVVTGGHRRWIGWWWPEAGMAGRKGLRGQMLQITAPRLIQGTILMTCYCSGTTIKSFEHESLLGRGSSLITLLSSCSVSLD
jgi:hypothetical protein